MTSDLFKSGYLVTDLEAAMRDLGRWLDVAWTPIQTSPLALRTGRGREDVELRFVYSTSGPVHLELLEAQRSGYYAAPEGAQLHHVGRWVDDLEEASERLEKAGLPLEACGVDEDGVAPALFAFHRGDHGLRVELVPRANRPAFEAWLAGGELSVA